MALNHITFALKDEEHTLKLGELLVAPLLNALEQVNNRALVVFLQGDLGAGKTTLTRSILRTLNFTGAVKSPTYTIVEPYNLPQLDIYHFDLYRIMDSEELELMGIRDYFAKKAICLIEWPDKGMGILNEPDVIVDIKHVGYGREVTLSSNMIAKENLNYIKEKINL